MLTFDVSKNADHSILQLFADGFPACACEFFYERRGRRGWVCYISTLATHEDHRRKGYATAVMKEVERIAVERGARELELRCSPDVDLENGEWIDLREFYEKFGFEVDERNDDDLLFWLMRKRLAQPVMSK